MASDSADRMALVSVWLEDSPARSEAQIRQTMDDILDEKAQVASLEQEMAYDSLMFEMVHRPIDDPLPLRYEHIVKVLEVVKEIFRAEPPLIEIEQSVVIVGDLHGSWKDLRIIFESLKMPIDVDEGIFIPAHHAHSFVFLGNYVDRGKQSLEVLMLLFAMKISQHGFGRHMYMLRGNHEQRYMNAEHGFKEELEERFDQWMADDLFEKFNDVFDHMPLACLVGSQQSDDKILCMHGGISPKLTSLDAIRNIPKPLEDLDDNELATDLVWADYEKRVKGFKPNDYREISVIFGAHALDATLERLGVKSIVRSHQKIKAGFEHEYRIVTVTSFIKNSTSLAAMVTYHDDMLVCGTWPADTQPGEVMMPIGIPSDHIEPSTDETEEDSGAIGEGEASKNLPSNAEKESGDFVIEMD